jgi:hypothetical protein
MNAQSILFFKLKTRFLRFEKAKISKHNGEEKKFGIR